MTGIAVVVLAAAWLPPAAFAGTNLIQRAGTEGCVNEDGYGGECQDGRGLSGPAGIALSPDGQDAYVVSSGWNGVTTLQREPNGALRPIQDPASCLVEVEVVYPACDAGRELRDAEGVAVSPDGKNVYVAARESDALTIFDRDAVTGLLTQSTAADGCVNRTGSDECTKGRALDGAREVTVSPDGKNVYVASQAEHGGIAVFRRDPETGALTQPAGAEGCINETGAEECADDFDLFTQVWDVVVSPDGNFLYAVSPVGDEILLFSRNPAGGALSRIPAPDGCVNETGANGCGAAKALGNPVALAFDSSGSTMYAAAERADAVVVFNRDTSTGFLEEKAGTAGCVSDTGWADPMQAATEGQCQDGIGLDGVDALAVSPDGSALYATAAFSDGLAIFERHADGTLTQRPGRFGCITETGAEAPQAPWTAGLCLDGRALRRADAITVGPHGLQVYASAREGGADTFDVVPVTAPPIEQAEPAPAAVEPPRRDRTACHRAVAELQSAAKALRHAVRRQTRLRQRLEAHPGSPDLIEALRKASHAVKGLRRKKHLAAHRERRLCRRG